jgi:60 kDa SS-A/Ro ribonucleoprotein
MATYKKTYFRKKIPTTSFLPGRKEEMKENLSNGISFKANDFIALRRWMLIGSMNSAFYQSSNKMTELNIDILEKCVKIDANKVSEEILYATEKGINNHTPILALVYLSKGNFYAKKKFREIFSKVIRTASHLYEFFSYCKELRGMGQTIHKTVNSWLDTRDAKELEYQFLKYQQREGWSARDVLRLIKPKTKNTIKNSVYGWAVGKIKETSSELVRLNAYEHLKEGNVPEHDVIKYINELNLTHEMIPANIKRTPEIWEALFQKMPVGASIRNLGNLTDKGIFKNLSNLDLLEAKLSKERLSKGRVHPLTIANAYKTYQRGSGFCGKLFWAPVPRICDIFEVAIEDSFDVLEPTGKVFFHAMDISASMTGNAVRNLQMNPMEIEGIMTLASIRSEKNYFVGGFSDNFVPLLNIRRKGCSFADVVSRKIFDGLKFGGTDAGSAYQYAISNDIYVDIFVFWTDNENWKGYQPSQLLKEYRSKVNKNAKAIYITLVPYGDAISLVDPKDPLSYDIAGFSSETPKLIQMIAKDII